MNDIDTMMIMEMIEIYELYSVDDGNDVENGYDVKKKIKTEDNGDHNSNDENNVAGYDIIMECK